ncbi:MAG: NAD-dependent epimerase/dehydratase family protein [Caldisphaera sp.]
MNHFKILITGGNGFIGSHLIDLLIKEKNYKLGITLRTFSDITKIKHNMKFLDIFYVDKLDVDNIISKFKPDIIIHLATYYKNEHLYDDIEKMIYSNIIFPTKILDSMVKNKVKYFINTGTFSEYFIDKSMINTNTKLSPRNLYSASKVSFEELLKFYVTNYDLNAITLKLFAPYGYRDNPKKLIPYLIISAIEGKEAEATLGNQKWDYVYVKDIAKAYLKGIEYILDNRKMYDVFNIGTGEAHNVREIADIINSFGNKLKVKWGAIPYRKNEIFYARADITHSINTLRWQPEYILKDGLHETYEYYEKTIKNGK